MKNNALAYSLKVWLTAVILGSLILCVFVLSPSSNNQHFDKQAASLVLITVFYSAIFSLPSFFILLLSSLGLCNTSLTDIYRKLILTGIGILLSLLAARLSFLEEFELSFTLSYLIVTLAGIWFYKLRSDKDEVKTVASDLTTQD